MILGPKNTTGAVAGEAFGISENPASVISHGLGMASKHVLLVSSDEFPDESVMQRQLSSSWSVHVFRGALRVREALLMGVRPEVMLVDLAADSDEMLDLIARIKKSADQPIRAMEIFACRCFDPKIKERAITLGVSAFVENPTTLLPLLGVNASLVIDVPAKLEHSEAEPEPKLDEPQQAEPQQAEPQQAELRALDSTTLDPGVLSWLKSHSHRDSRHFDSKYESQQQDSPLGSQDVEPHLGLLLHGKLFFHRAENTSRKADSTTVNNSPRPLRLALLKQQLRSDDDLMTDDQGQFWLSLRTDNELKAIRVALRIAVALTRSTDPRHFVVGVALSGAYLSDDSTRAMQICKDTLPQIEPSGQLAVAVDRWKFSMPLLVAQALV